MTAMDVMNGIPHLLWTTSWQAGAMAGSVWLACRQWPRMPANLRVMLWWLVSLKFVVGLLWTQPIGVPILPADAPAQGADQVSITVSREGVRSSDVVLNASDSTTPGLETPGSARGNTPFRSQFEPLSLGEGFGERVFYIWLLGVIAQGVLLVGQLARTRRLIASSRPVEGDAAELFDDLVTRLELRACTPRPELRVSTAIATPQVTGLMRPVILLPVGALESFSTRELSLTLCHELMHIKRFDLWHGWIPSVAARAAGAAPAESFRGRLQA
jgi:bla regulator protein blaR1